MNMKKVGIKGWAVILIGGVFVFSLYLLPSAVLAQGEPTAQPASPDPLPAGDAERGRDYFMGSAHFENGGPPCMGCHNIDQQGLLGGGKMGPDLTDVSQRFSDAELAQLLASLPDATTRLIFSENPLTPQEQADLRAFLEASAGEPVADRELLLFGLSLAGLAGAAGLLAYIYRRRLRSVRAAMVKGAQSDGKGKQG